MISSLSSFSGLSIAEVQTLFGTNSTSSTSASASTSSNGTTQSASIKITTASANDPAAAIKQILAHAQIEGTRAATLGGADGGMSPSSANADSPNILQMGSSDSSVNSSTNEISSFSYSLQQASQVGGLEYSTDFSVSSVSSASGTIDEFHFDVSLGGQSLSVDLAVAGLGPITTTPVGTLSAGDGDYSVQLSA